MRVAVDHCTRYQFTEPQDRLIQLLRMRPSDTDHQTVVNWRIDVDCDARLRKQEDGFGNEVTMLYCDGPIEAIEISAVGEVLTDDRAGGIVVGANEPLPPLLYRRDTEETRADAAIVDFARTLDAGGGAMLDRLHRLNMALTDRFEAIPDKPLDHRAAADVFAGSTASRRELAQLFCAAARAIEVPARYVSGYRADTRDAPRSAPHGWAEAWVEDLGWVGFDPSAGMSPDERYVRVATALDVAGATPISGWRMGGGEETLEVAVQAGEA